MDDYPNLTRNDGEQVLRGVAEHVDLAGGDLGCAVGIATDLRATVHLIEASHNVAFLHAGTETYGIDILVHLLWFHLWNLTNAIIAPKMEHVNMRIQNLYLKRYFFY